MCVFPPFWKILVLSCVKAAPLEVFWGPHRFGIKFTILLDLGGGRWKAVVTKIWAIVLRPAGMFQMRRHLVLRRPNSAKHFSYAREHQMHQKVSAARRHAQKLGTVTHEPGSSDWYGRVEGQESIYWCICSKRQRVDGHHSQQAVQLWCKLYSKTDIPL